MKKKLFLTISAIFTLFFMSLSITLSAKEQTPLDTIKTIYVLLKKYDANSPTVKQDRATINGFFMIDAMAHDAIEDHWAEMTSSQKKRYMTLMYKLLLKTVYDDTGQKVQKGYYTIRGTRIISSTRQMVLTTITIVKSDLKVSNDFSMLKVGSTWKVRSIFIDNANLALDYKSQFNQIITKYGIDKTPDSLLPRIDAATQKSDDWTQVDDDKTKEKKATQKEITQKRPTLLEG